MKRLGTDELVSAIAGGGVLETLTGAVELRRRRVGAEELAALLELARGGDELGRLAAAYAAGRTESVAVDRALLDLLDSESASLRQAASLTFSERRCHPPAVAPLVREATAGGFGGMLAELALDDWHRRQPNLVGGLLRRALGAGQLPAPGVTAVLARPAVEARPEPRRRRQASGGLRIAQVFLQGRVDGELREAGAGDGGGLATLVVHLSRALGRRAEIDHVVTVTRAFADEHARAPHDLLHEPLDANASIERVAFGPEGYLATPDMWAHRLEAEAALERSLTRLLPLDVVHLRFADVGTLAAARVSRRLGIPVCFTLAADPHVVIRARERSGALTRETFARADEHEHFLFRAHLVESMLERADGLVLFPRTDAAADLNELLGVDVAKTRPGRIRTVSEGISLETLDRAARARAADREPAPEVLRDLEAAVGALPRTRAGLPLLLSVGRFHRVKGFGRLLEAWAGEPELFERFNLALVGGDLEHPTLEERAVLQSLREAGARHPGARRGLLLLGHRSHAEVAQLLHVARSGLGPAVAGAGVYACASDKEEFGLAVLEALAVGLPVVAPRTGGPATYVEDGRAGCLVDTSSVGELRRGLLRAAALRHDSIRAERASALVRSRFSVDAMAEQLSALYVDLTEPSRLERAA